MEKRRVTLPLRPQFPYYCLDMGKRQTWKKGQSLVRPEPATGLYIFATGQLRLVYHYVQDGEKRRRLIFMIDSPGAVFEAICLLGVRPDLEAIVTVEAETTFLDAATIERLMNEDPTFHGFLTYNVTFKQGLLVRSVLWNESGQTTAALLDFLHERARTLGERNADGTVRVPVDRTTLGEDLGTHPRTLIRWLRQLEEQGEVKLWRGGVTLLKPAAWKMTQGTRNLIDYVGEDGL